MCFLEKEKRKEKQIFFWVACPRYVEGIYLVPTLLNDFPFPTALFLSLSLPAIIIIVIDLFIYFFSLKTSTPKPDWFYGTAGFKQEAKERGNSDLTLKYALLFKFTRFGQFV